MKGQHRIVIRNKRIQYDFVLKRNLTVIRGDSATGKTTLIDMVREFDENGEASGVTLQCDKACTTLSGKRWETELQEIRDSIVFIDEGNEFIFTNEFAACIQKTDNYYVIATREGIPSLPYSVNEIYGIRNSGKYGELKQTYQEFYHLYNVEDYRKNIKPYQILTEDSNSGYQFFKTVSGRKGIECKSAEGKSNIFAVTSEYMKQEQAQPLVIIADGAAFGSEMEKVTNLIRGHQEIVLYLPESFEWLILKANLVEDKEISLVLNAPEDYIESEKYFSWERFFTAFLIQKTRDSYLRYAKKELNSSYLNEKISERILDVIERIELD